MKYSDVDAVAAGEPWSIAGVMYGLEQSVDDEGRPIYERRAPSDLKEGVPMDIRRCPYQDARLDRSMNVSALAQITRHLDCLLDDIHAFRACLPARQMSWSDAYTVLVDQLIKAALFRLRNPSPSAAIPALASVAYKLAVGFSTPLREMLVLQARGDRREVTAEALLSLVEEREFLVGAREACAGPTNLLIRSTEALLGAAEPASTAADPVRLQVAQPLALQVQLGIAFSLYDEALEWQLLSGNHAAGRLSPRTQFLQRMLQERLAVLQPGEVGQAPQALPASLDESLLDGLRHALTPAAEPPLVTRNAQVIEELLHAHAGAVEIGFGGEPALAHAFAAYLHAHRAFVNALFELEGQARRAAGLTGPAGFAPHVTVLSPPRALRWFEMVTGYRLRSDPRPAELYTLRSTETEVPLAV